MKINVNSITTLQVTDANTGSPVTLPPDLLAQVTDNKTYEYTPASVTEVDPNAEASGQ